MLPTAAGAWPRQQPDGPVETTSIPASRERGLDMILVDAETMPAEPELAPDFQEVVDESFTGAPVDLLKPMHHLYTDLRRQLMRYQMKWSGLPQVQVPEGAPMAAGSKDPRVADLRERLGLSRAGGFDKALAAKLTDYQRAHGLGADGKAGAGTLASLNRGAGYYEKLILLNMERARRLPAPGTVGKYILVDAGSARMWMYEDGRPVDSMKVIVGAPATETPMMAAMMRFANVNPYWNVPPDLVQKLIAPRVLADGRTYLDDRGYEVLESWRVDAPVVDPMTIDWAAVAEGREEIRVRQLPGGANSMGKIKFMLPNQYGIYLHDTPKKELFGEEKRWLSNGCIRLEDAQRLAQWIFGDMPEPSDPAREDQVDLDETIPVYITYMTVGADAGETVFRADPYERDAPLLERFAGVQGSAGEAEDAGETGDSRETASAQ